MIVANFQPHECRHMNGRFPVLYNIGYDKNDKYQFAKKDSCQVIIKPPL